MKYGNNYTAFLLAFLACEILTVLLLLAAAHNTVLYLSAGENQSRQGRFQSPVGAKTFLKARNLSAWKNYSLDQQPHQPPADLLLVREKHTLETI